MSLTATLPGIAFEVVPRALDDALPRMDVCGFVGFALRGPIDVPVLIEDPVKFRDVFGDDPVLARTDDGVDVRGFLGPAVEAFFANGGRRAWVVRVARTGPDGAITNRFGVPGLVVPGPPGSGVASWRLAALPAGSAGAWSDGLTAGATLVVTPLGATALDDEHLLVDHGAEVVPGDLVRVTLADGEYLLVPASEVQQHADGYLVAIGPSDGWLVTERPLIIADGAAYLLGVDGPVSRPTFAITSLVSEQVVEIDESEPLRPGDIVAIEPLPPKVAITLVTVGEELFDDVAAGARRFEISDLVNIMPGPADWTSMLSLATEPMFVEIQRLRLTVRRDTAIEAELDGLGFSASHPHAVAALPADDHLYPLLAGLPRTPLDREVTADDLVARDLTPLERAALASRFPLCGPADAPLLLPIGLTTDPTATVFGPPPGQIDVAPTPVRNGLAAFDAGLFVDSALAGLGIDTIVPTAWDLSYVRHPPRRLHGIHALATNDDITLVCVPDAVHHGWERIRIPAPHPLDAPVLDKAIVDPDGAHLTWSTVAAATGYQLEYGDDESWVLPHRVDVDGTTTTLANWDDCPHVVYVRVRAIRASEVGPWSNVIGMVVPTTTFGPCEEVYVSNPTPGQSAEPIPDEIVWRLRPAAEAAPWADLRAIQTATLRWCAARGDVFAVLTLPLAFTAGEALRHVGELRGAGSAVGVTTSSLQSPFLAAGVPALTDDESDVLGYGALYHPWPVIGRPDTGGVRAVPPDGGIAGTYAARSLERGAWIAPARVALNNIVALAPSIDERQLLPLVLSGVDPIAADPSGFMTLTANTMTDVAAVRQINVRRLIMLLRRLARREGAGIVFEPNDRELQRLVGMRFERLMTQLFQRGAFAGAVPEEAFEVSTGDNVNPPASIEAGRFIVDVRFAPSRPLEFITVKLVLAGSSVGVERT
jgi:hypothetical protein